MHVAKRLKNVPIVVGYCSVNNLKVPEKVIIHSDGASRGNPGKAAIGVIIQDESGNILRIVSRFIGVTTNNQAEYKALIAGLEEAAALGASEVVIFVDSELVVMQIKGRYRVKKPQLVPLYLRAGELLAGFKSYTIEHVPRSLNGPADRLANLALDKH